MDAISTAYADSDYAGAAPILIAGEGAEALERARRTIEAGGHRVAAVGIDRAVERIAIQPAMRALWVELVDGGADSDRLIDRVRDDVRDGRYPAVVAAPSSMIDRLHAALELVGVDLLIDADELERASALAVVTSDAARADRVCDVSADRNNDRLRQLSDEVSRIASTLARLSAGPVGTAVPATKAVEGEAPPVAVETVRAVIRARRLRNRFFADDLFADPAWDMLLDLLQAEIAQLRVPVSSLCIAASVPATTALRWLKSMTAQGLFVRRADPHDARRVFVELAPHASAAMRRYFAEVGPVPVI